MKSRSIARELALLLLSQIPEDVNHFSESFSCEVLLSKAMESLTQHLRDNLDHSASRLEIAQQHLIDSQLADSDKISIGKIRSHLSSSIEQAENVLNSLSSCLEFPTLLALCDQEEIRNGALTRVTLAIEQRTIIDSRLDGCMEGWRLKRLPRIDRDILRLAVVDLMNLKTPIAVSCNEAVDLANRYSDTQGRRMINGVLRRLQTVSPKI